MLKDSVAGAMGTAGAGVVQFNEVITGATHVTDGSPIEGGLVSLACGVITMLISRWLNNMKEKKRVKNGLNKSETKNKW